MSVQSNLKVDRIKLRGKEMLINICDFFQDTYIVVVAILRSTAPISLIRRYSGTEKSHPLRNAEDAGHGLMLLRTGL